MLPPIFRSPPVIVAVGFAVIFVTSRGNFIRTPQLEASVAQFSKSESKSEAVSATSAPNRGLASEDENYLRPLQRTRAAERMKPGLRRATFAYLARTVGLSPGESESTMAELTLDAEATSLAIEDLLYDLRRRAPGETQLAFALLKLAEEVPTPNLLTRRSIAKIASEFFDADLSPEGKDLKELAQLGIHRYALDAYPEPEAITYTAERIRNAPDAATAGSYAIQFAAHFPEAGDRLEATVDP